MDRTILSTVAARVCVALLAMSLSEMAAAATAGTFDFVLGDARKLDWSGADCLFMNSTCFDEPLMLELAAVADNMKVGSFAITFTKRLPSAKWQVCESEVHVMSWGTATVFIHKKIVA